MGPLCPCPNSKKPMKKGTRGISWGPLLTPGPQAVPEFPNGQSAPGSCRPLGRQLLESRKIHELQERSSEPS
ncbi:unnamed protein product [Staurois parvus]|uniref:Uncharacterized protein n=1 Tax=Staurois parvus TaxID=386267 RepID=A0ABN9GUA5_9NEOB|nr:unnamed protein product [Staurois parvus]